MATEIGGGLIKDSVVYGYDTQYGVANNSTSTISYPGEPTVNYVTDGSILQNGWSGSFSLIDSATKSFKLNVSNFNGSAGSGQGWRSFMWDMRSHAGSAVTISATIEVSPDSPGDFAWVMMGQANSGSGGASTSNYLGYSAGSEKVSKSTNTKQRITWSGTIGNTGTANQPNGVIGFTVWYNGGTSGTDHFIRVSNVQIEKKSHETPFVNGTRSETASLIDLKKTTDINLASVSFDVNGQLFFDGSDDILSTGLYSGRNPLTNAFSIEAIVKSDTTSGSRMWLDATSNGTNQRLYCAHASTGTSTPLGIQNNGWSHSIPQDTNYHHYVITMNNGTATLYNNGVSHSSKSYTSYGIQALRVGGRGTQYAWSGPIPVFKLHDRSLTVDEIKENYKSYKNRFNL
jgi:hypothetical protein